MTIREMISKYRTNCTVEIRCNNFKVMEFHSEDMDMVKDELLDKEVDNWFVDNTQALFKTRERVVFDYREEQEWWYDRADGNRKYKSIKR